jgi:hypothetical protein
MKTVKLIFKFIKYKAKQLFCKHKYIQSSKFTGHNIQHNKDIIFNYDFECVKCGKITTIEMDEESQLNSK